MNEFIRISLEYLEAAEVLYNLGNRSRPVIFCYIQSSELFLKGLAQQQGVLSESLRKTHNLLELWDCLNHPAAQLRLMVAELSTIDPKTTRFRYPNSGEAVDLEAIRQKVLALHQLFPS